ncbi:LysE family translocator [Gymnodinialimonas sp. 2305UL16-5]|uniref:LysE family translocator n=1 Tax=Gymnodinialimonas mytili TaxID=3126503 RepID=UPI00309F4FA8
MEYASTFATLTLIGLIGWATPGPNMAAVASAAVSQGRGAGILTGLGISVGGLLWAGLAVTGVGVVFETLPTLFLILKLAGAAYLIWLGLRMFRRHPSPGIVLNTVPSRDFWFGMGVVLTNPKAVLFHGALLAAIVPVGAPMWLLVAIVIWTQTQAALAHAVTAHLFSRQRVQAVFTRLGAWTNRLFGAVFVALGGAVIWQSLRRTGP